MSILFATLNPDGTLSNQRTLEQSSIAACRFSIMTPEHYRADGSCKCDDREHRAMMVREWEYTEADFEGIPLRGIEYVREEGPKPLGEFFPPAPAPGDKPTPAMTGDRLEGGRDALLVTRRWAEPFADVRVCYRLFMTGSFETPDAVADFLAMRKDDSGEWVVALHAAYHHDGRDVETVAQRRALAKADADDFADKLADVLRATRATKH